MGRTTPDILQEGEKMMSNPNEGAENSLTRSLLNRKREETHNTANQCVNTLGRGRG